MEKLYNRINFENQPSQKTPVNAANLNKMDKALNDLDNRMLELYGLSIILGADGVLYQFGIDDGGVFIVPVSDATVVAELNLGDDDNATYYVESDAGTHSIDNAVESEAELTEDTYNFNII